MRDDWSPEIYGRFRGFRLRPALDLIAQIDTLPSGDIVDLGCGAGGVADALVARWPDRRLIGVDGSAQMLEQAALTGRYTGLHHADIRNWQPETPPALIFSNAALHWLDDHAVLFARLAGMLTRGGTLAVQMPRQNQAPSHRLAREIAARMIPDCYDPTLDPIHCAPAEDYVRMLAPLGTVNAWETTYIQTLAQTDAGHPIRAFTESTVLRPILNALGPALRRAYLSRYDAALARAYPPQHDGRVLFAFLRCFLVLKV